MTSSAERRQFDPERHPVRYALFTWRLGREDTPIVSWSAAARRTFTVVPLTLAAVIAFGVMRGADPTSSQPWIALAVVVLLPLGAVAIATSGYPVWMVRSRSDWSNLEYVIGKLGMLALLTGVTLGPALVILS